MAAENKKDDPLNPGSPYPEVKKLTSDGAREGPVFKDARRLQESITARAERRALVWLAARMPSWVHSDHLTLLGFISMFLAGTSYAFARWHRAGLILATLFLALNWFGDSLDGTLARIRNRQRPRYGFYVDHMVDTFGALFLMGGLALSGFVDSRIALGMFIAFLMLSIEAYLAAHTIGIFRLSYWKVGAHGDSHSAGSRKHCFVVESNGAGLRLGLSPIRHWRLHRHGRYGGDAHRLNDQPYSSAIPRGNATMRKAQRHAS